MKALLRLSSLALVASAMIACNAQIMGGSGGGGGGGAGGAGGGSGCPAPNPGMCVPSDCIDGHKRTGSASCQNGQWVCDTVPCSTGCDGSIIKNCSGGMITQFCCPPGAPCAAPGDFCDLGNGACSDGPCTDAGAPCSKGSIFAADYDQSCASDGDCAPVYEGSLCTNCRCAKAAVNQQALSAYSAAIAAAQPPVSVCDCADVPPPVCQAGTCVLP